MKNLWKKWIFIAQFHFQDPDPDSGSSLAIRIRIHPDPDPKHLLFLGSSKLYHAANGRSMIYGIY